MSAAFAVLAAASLAATGAGELTRIRSVSADYDRGAGMAVFEGDVRVEHAGEYTMNSDSLYAVMSSSNELDRVVAYGSIPEFKMRQFREYGLTGCLAPEGHAVVKVNPGGFAFKLYTLSAKDESMRIVGVRDFLCC